VTYESSQCTFESGRPVYILRKYRHELDSRSIGSRNLIRVVGVKGESRDQRHRTSRSMLQIYVMRYKDQSPRQITLELVTKTIEGPAVGGLVGGVKRL
jgi:hypothetical protein